LCVAGFGSPKENAIRNRKELEALPFGAVVLRAKLFQQLALGVVLAGNDAADALLSELVHLPGAPAAIKQSIAAISRAVVRAASAVRYLPGFPSCRVLSTYLQKIGQLAVL